jgi:peptidoglycan/xylan/chitin deacetylase (PgdA/CDA1 family)
MGPTATASDKRTARRGWLARVRRMLAPPTLVLLYHRVLPDPAADPLALAVSTANFAAQLDWLRTNTRVLDPAAFPRHWERVQQGEFCFDGGRPRVLITFDDGYADNAHHAQPLLVARGCPALVFVTTDHVGTAQPFWWDALAALVFDAPHPLAPDAGRDLGIGALPADPGACFAMLHTRLKDMFAAERTAALDDLAARQGFHPSADDDSRAMSWDELRAWQAGGLAVGAHTRSHPRLADLTPAEQHAEIAGSRSVLADGLGTPPALFAYPYGTGADFGDDARTAAQAAGFACAFANWPGNARWARDRFALPRYLVRDWSVGEFAARFQSWCPA